MEDIMIFFSKRFIEIENIAKILHNETPILEKMVEILMETRKNMGRLFICGVGGGAGNGTHAAGDFLKSCNIQSICITDNVPNLTAITNDDGWAKVFSNTLRAFETNANDALLIFSVGGGSKEKKISENLIEAVELAKQRGAKVIGIVGKKDGFTAQHGDAVVVVPNLNPQYLTAHTESWQSYLSHLLVETLREQEAKWESTEK